MIDYIKMASDPNYVTLIESDQYLYSKSYKWNSI
jgi:hypothetical protein